MDAMPFLILSLATWRIASLFVNEEGPFDIFKKIREWAGIQHDEQGEIYLVPDRFLPKLLSCVWCFSVWVAISMAIFFCLFPTLALWAALPMAISAVAIIIQEIIE